MKLVHLKYLNSFGFEQFWKKECSSKGPEGRCSRIWTQISKIQDGGSNMADVDPENLKLEN